MTRLNQIPRILLISQWPNIKNAEYELIEKIRRTPFTFTVVDYLGFDVETNQCLNTENLYLEYDFAIAFHYDTPNFLNLPTFFWVANPLEFMHLGRHYRDTVFQHCRSYDGYLFNDSDPLAQHIHQILRHESFDPSLRLYASSAISDLKLCDIKNHKIPKLFYCGINWERLSDKTGRSQGLLELLEEKNLAEFYGPTKIDNKEPWQGFKHYKGEIPFDGITMNQTLQQYAALLALSSPAHLKSKTSSSRVFEGFTAGVPVISDQNPHVKKLFGDCVYYFEGTSDQDKVASIQKILQHIINNPEEALDKVTQAQQKIRQSYAFDITLKNIYESVSASYHQSITLASAVNMAVKTLDVFLMDHDPYVTPEQKIAFGKNISHIITALSYVAKKMPIHVRLVCVSEQSQQILNQMALPNFITGVEFSELSIDHTINWSERLLGDKLYQLSKTTHADYVYFFRHAEFPRFDYFYQTITWYEQHPKDTLQLAGFYISDHTTHVTALAQPTYRNAAPMSLMEWSQQSLYEHALEALCFTKMHVAKFDWSLFRSLDALSVIAILLHAEQQGFELHRSRFYSLRFAQHYFTTHYATCTRVLNQNFWAQHYDLLSNYQHELNKLFDLFFENKSIIKQLDLIAGYYRVAMAVDPAIDSVNRFITKLRKVYRGIKKVKSIVRLKRA